MEFTFKCDSTSLDFVGTLKARREQESIDVLGTPADVAAWFREAGIVDDLLEVSSREFDRAIEVREAVWAAMASHLDGCPVPDAALATLNRAASKPDPIPELTATGRRVTSSPDGALSAIARDAITLLTGPEASLIKECSRDGCNQVYVDRSRGGRREWCAMDPCGNRVKAREYRARKAATA